MNGTKPLSIVAFILLVIGGLNWLLVGILQWDIGQLFGGADAIVSRVIYILVGLSAIYLIFSQAGEHQTRTSDTARPASLPR